MKNIMHVPNLDLCALLWFVGAFESHSVRPQVENSEITCPCNILKSSISVDCKMCPL